jgi:hypothetical protein
LFRQLDRFRFYKYGPFAQFIVVKLPDCSVPPPISIEARPFALVGVVFQYKLLYQLLWFAIFICIPTLVFVTKRQQFCTTAW